MRALVVDDSMTIRRIIIKALSMIGCSDAMEAANGIEALEALKSNKFDLILLDWNMPKMTGLETLKIIRSEGKRIPVVMVTTESEKSRVIEAIKAGATDYLIKPFTPEQLAGKVKNLRGMPVGAS